jgi:hypothetical protein
MFSEPIAGRIEIVTRLGSPKRAIVALEEIELRLLELY